MAEHGPSPAGEAKAHNAGGEGKMQKGVNAAADFVLDNGLGIVKDFPDVIGEFFGAGGSHGSSAGSHAVKKRH